MVLVQTIRSVTVITKNLETVWFAWEEEEAEHGRYVTNIQAQLFEHSRVTGETSERVPWIGNFN
jgi:hypothetical protein